MADISVVILMKDEKLHIKRCLERLRNLNPQQIFIVDCFSTDGSVELATETAGRLGLNLQVVQRKWPGLYAAQFGWALENLPIEAEWILRLDADEYLTSDTIEKLKRFLSTPTPNTYTPSNEVAGLTLELKRWIFGGEIRHATNGIRLLRIFRRGRAKIEQRAMDEHMLVDGKVIDFDGAFYDHNVNTFEWWKEKHRGYAKREAQDAIALFADADRLSNPSPTDRKKIAYYKLPRYVRAVAYFCIRYFLKGGFLDGRVGWKWNFWQGLWYRWIVDREIGRLRA